MLMKDVEDGIDKMEIWQLWESREEHKAFPYDFFHKRVYEVRQKACAAPYWQVKMIVISFMAICSLSRRSLMNRKKIMIQDWRIKNSDKEKKE
jgi:hypothetical protein